MAQIHFLRLSTSQQVKNASLYRARNPGECKSHLEFMHRVVRSGTAKRHVGLEEVGEQVEEDVDVAGVGG